MLGVRNRSKPMRATAMFEGMIRGAVVGAVLGVILGVLLLVARLFNLLPSGKCPQCGEQLPQLRKPANRKQLLWGGGTCPKCGCEIDARGRKVEK
jgi:hypothetical protein